jgi:hypothetical protein
MPDLFDPQFSPEIIRATDELRAEMGPLHVAAVRVGNVWASVREAVNKAQSAQSIKEYMKILLETRKWEGGEALRQRLRLHLIDGCIANWQLIAREHAAGTDYYVFPTLGDLIADEEHWGLGLTEAELQAFIEPEEPSLWAKIVGALNHAQQGTRTDLEELRDKNVPKSEADEKQQDRTRALGRALENPKVGEMFDDQVLPKTVAAQFGTVSKDADYEQLKAECLERAYAVYAEAKQTMVDKPMAEQGKIISNTKKQVREALEPIKRWKAKPLGSADNPEWAQSAASLLVNSYTSEELGSLIAELSRLSSI